MALTAAEIIVSVGADISKLTAGLGAAQSKIKAMSAGMTSAGKSLTRSVTLPIVGVGVAATKMALDFESSMTDIRALVGASDKQMEQYRVGLLKLAKEGPVGPKELADALYFVTSSGFKGAEALSVLKASARASAAGLGETKVVADAVTSAVNAYGIEALSAGKATDILLAAVREGKSEPEELAASIGRVISPAQVMGVEFQEVAGVLASLSLVGIDASEGVTALRGTMMGILKPTDDTRKFLDKAGESIGSIRKELAEKGLLETFGRLAKKFKGNQDAIGTLFPNVRALNGFLALTGKNADKTAKAMGGVANSAGDTNKAFGKAMEDTTNRMKAAWASIQASMIQVGSVVLPLIGKIADFIGKMATKFDELSGPTKTAIVALLGFAAALGPILMLLGFLLSPIGAIALALAALGAAFVFAYTRSEEFRSAVSGALEALRGVVSTVVTFVKGKIAELAVWWKANGEQIKKDVSETWNGIKAIMEPILRVLSVMVQNTLAQIKNFVEMGLKVILGLVKFFAAVLRGDWSAAWDALKGIFSAIWGGIKAIITQAFRGFAAVAKALWTNIGSKMLEGLKAGTANLLGLIGKKLSELGDKIKGWAGSAYAYAFKIGTSIVNGIVDGIKSLAGKLADAAQTVYDNTIGKIGGLLKVGSPSRVAAEKLGKPIAQGIAMGMVDGMKGAEDDMIVAVKHMGKTLHVALSALVDAKTNKKVEDEISVMFRGALSNVHIDAVKEFAKKGGQALTGGLARAIYAGKKIVVSEAQQLIIDATNAARTTMDSVAVVWKEFITAQKILPAATRSKITAAFAEIGLALRARTITDSDLEAVRLKLEQLSTFTATAIEKAKAKIEEKRTVLTDAFSRLSGDALRAFDASVEAWSGPAQKMLDKLLSDRDVEEFKGRLASAQQALSDAQSGIGFTAVEGESPEEAVARVKRQQEAILLAQKAIDDLMFEQKKTALEKQIIEENKQHTAEAELKRRHFEGELTKLGERLQKQKGPHKTVQDEIIKLLNKYGIEYKASGLLLGNAFAQGLRESESEVIAAAKALAAAVKPYLKTKSPTEKGPLSDLDTWWTGFAPTLLSGLDTGAITGALNGAFKAVEFSKWWQEGKDYIGGMLPNEDDMVVAVKNMGNTFHTALSSLTDATARRRFEDEIDVFFRGMSFHVPLDNLMESAFRNGKDYIGGMLANEDDMLVAVQHMGQTFHTALGDLTNASARRRFEDEVDVFFRGALFHVPIDDLLSTALQAPKFIRNLQDFAGTPARAIRAAAPSYAMAGESSCMTINVDVPVYLDGRKIAEVMRTENKKYGKRNGNIYGGLA